MVQFDELKHAWSATHTHHRLAEGWQPADVQRTIHVKSLRPVSKIKRALQVKIRMATIIGMVGLCMSAIYASLHADDRSSFLHADLSNREMTILTGLMAGVVLALAWYQRRNYLQIVAFEQTSHSLRTSLQEVVRIMEDRMRTAVYLDTLATPFFTAWVAYVYLYDDGPFAWDVRCGYLVVVVLMTLVVAHIASKWLQQRKYGAYLDQLRENLDELDDDSVH